MSDRIKLAITLSALVGSIGCTQQRIQTAQTDFCAARAAYKVFAAAQNGKLDPAPGSPRAKLETEEDKFCAIVGK